MADYSSMSDLIQSGEVALPWYWLVGVAMWFIWLVFIIWYYHYLIERGGGMGDNKV